MILDKAKMAHDWVMKYGKVDSNYNRENTVQLAWDYADAMQAEADKRNNKETCDKNIGLDSSALKPSNSMELEWQPDWSQAPAWANYFDEWKEEQERIHNDYDAENAWYAGQQSQQAKIEEMQRKIAFQEKAIKNIKLQFENKQIDCDRSDRKIDELQARVDGALKELELLNCYRTGNSDNAINILKGNKDEN